MTIQRIVTLIVIIGGACISLIAWAYGERAAIRKRNARFLERPDMSREEIFINYYGDSTISRETVDEIFDIIADGTKIPATKLRPSDRFDMELAPPPGWAYDNGELLNLSRHVKDIWKKSGRPEPTQKLDTVDDAIRYVDSLKKQVETRPV